MKISIELTDQQVKGIKAYLLEVDGEKADKKAIQQYIQGVVECTLQSPHEAVNDYINAQK